MPRLDVPQNVERELATRAVRSNVSPEERYRKDREAYKRDYLHALYAESEGKRLDAVKPDAGRDTTDKEAQRGIELESSRIIGRLRKLNPNLWFEQSNADATKMGIYYLDPLAEGGRRFLCGFETGISPEFSVRLVDENGNFKSEKRGWRTVLSKLIRKGFISEVGAFALFGPPSRDSEFWYRQTQ